MADVRERSGRIDVLLHAAGLEISRNLPDKEPREFDLVFDVKSDGWFNLFHAARRPADRRHGGVLVGGRALRQPGADRLRRGQRPALQDHLEPAPDEAGHPRAGARLDGMGRHRHGHARLDPEDHGDGRRADAAARSRRRLDPTRAAVERSSRRGHRRRHARHDGGRAGPDRAGWTRPSRRRGEHGPMVGSGAAERARRHRRDGPTLDPTRAAVPRPPPHRRRRRAARCDGHRGVRRSGRVCSRRTTTSSALRRHGVRRAAEVLPRRAAHDHACRRCCAPTATTSSPMPGSVAERMLPGQAEPQRTVHFTGTRAARS